MKTIVRSTLGLLGVCALAPFSSAQSAQSTQSTPERADAAATATPTEPATPVPPAPPAPPPTAAAGRFTTFDGASPTVLDAVRNAQGVATSIRSGLATASPDDPALTRAVSQASAAIVQEGRAARTDLLAGRQSALTRLRAAQTATERERLISDLRTQTGQRLDEQREAARLVRDRLRELRDTTAITRPGGS
ncbi:MAG: hypothetical protein V4773_19060 [Verrucomicrobiota bacterium]